MKLSLYLDEDSQDTALVRALRSRGIEVMTATEAGMVHRDDEEQLAWATQQGRVLYTCNARDFYLLLRLFLTRGESHAGIIILPQQRYSVGEQMRRLLKLVATKSAEEMRDQVEFLSAWGQ